MRLDEQLTSILRELGAPADALVQFDEGKLGCPVDADEPMELALLRVDFGDVDVDDAAATYGRQAWVEHTLALSQDVGFIRPSQPRFGRRRPYAG